MISGLKVAPYLVLPPVMFDLISAYFGCWLRWWHILTYNLDAVGHCLKIEGTVEIYLVLYGMEEVSR